MCYCSDGYGGWCGCAGYSDGCGGCAYNGDGDYVDYSGECGGSCSSSCGRRAHVVVPRGHVLLCLGMGYGATNLQGMCSATGDKFVVFTKLCLESRIHNHGIVPILREVLKS